METTHFSCSITKKKRFLINQIIRDLFFQTYQKNLCLETVAVYCIPIKVRITEKYISMDTDSFISS